MSNCDWRVLLSDNLDQFPDVHNWTHEGKRLTTEQAQRLSDIESAADDRIDTLVLGVSAIGNLLACTASNGTTGLCDETAAAIGWLLEDMGHLIYRCKETASAAGERLRSMPVEPTEV